MIEITVGNLELKARKTQQRGLSMSYKKYHVTLGPVAIRIYAPGGSLEPNHTKQDMNIGPSFLNLRRWKVARG